MFQAAAVFGGGLALREQMEGISLPSVRRAGVESFKITVRVLAASLPGLQHGMVSCHRPYLEMSLGSTEKETEFADYAGHEPSEDVGKCAQDCPWRFSDSITFRASLPDLMGQGLKLRLFTRKDVNWWPMQFQMRPVHNAEGLVDLKTRVLPAMERRAEGQGVDIGTRAFMSPLVLVALSHVKGGILAATTDLGQAVAHVAMVFSMDRDPEEVFVAAGFRPRQHVQEAVQAVQEGVAETSARASKTLNDVAETACNTGKQAQRNVSRAGDAVGHAYGRLDRAVESFDLSVQDKIGQLLAQPSPIEEVCKLGAKLPVPTLQWGTSSRERPIDVEAAKRRAEMRQWAMGGMGQDVINDPDLDQEGWVSHRGPSGQVYWHHRSMGPAPWEVGGSTPPGASAQANSFSPDVSGLMSPGTVKSGATAKSVGLSSPDESPEGWLSYKRKDGRVLWHHETMGPAPWTTPEGKALLEGASP